MIKTAKPLLLAALLASVSALALPALAAPAPSPAPTASKATVAPIPYKERVLANGLRVLTAIDKTTPNVTVQVWYGVGGKDDPKGRSGFAHLFEHLMFKSTRDMPAEQMDRLTEDVGGENNASTDADFTDYYELIPAGHLDRLLWAEAERMSSLQVSDADFKSERDVVKEELRQRVLADPYGRFEALMIPEASYGEHPYKRPVIGSIKDLDGATLEDVRAFHATYYRPDDAVLVVVGNFDQASIEKTIDAYFGPIARPAKAIPRNAITEPARTGPRTVTGYGPTVPLPAVAITWLIPEAANSDLAALKVADAVLSNGKSSRLYRDLVYRKQLVRSVGADAGTSQQPGLFQVTAVMAGGKPLAEGEAALMEEIKQLRDAPVAAAELARAKNQLVSDSVNQRETILGRGVELGAAYWVEGSAAHANTDIAELQAVTPADVQRVAHKYLLDDRRVVIRYLDESQKPKGEANAFDEEALESIGRPTPVGAVSPPAPEALPKTAPTPMPPLSTKAPLIEEKTLKNGVRVIVSRNAAVPLVTATLLVKHGAAGEPRAGGAVMMASLLTEGTTTMSAEAISETVEAAGGSISSGAGYDSSQVALTVLSDQFAATLPVMADVVRHPAFKPEELERRRAEAVDRLTVAFKEPGALAGMVAARAVFGAGGYGEVAGGTPASLKVLSVADVKAAYAAAFRPSDAVLVITGDIAPGDAFALAEKNFGDWSVSAPAASAAPATVAYPAPTVTVVDLPGTGQAAVLVTAPSIQRSDANYYRAIVANGVLGGGYSARLNEEVRVKRGLSYGAGSRIDARRFGGIFTASAQTKNETAPDVASLLLDEAKGLSKTPITGAELDARKATLVGSYGRAVEQGSGLASVLAQYSLYGVDLGEVGRYAGKVQGVNEAGAKGEAAIAIDPAKASVVIVGDAKLFLPKLKAAFPNVRVIEASALDLDSPTLGAGK